jgi:putative ATPase
LKAYGAALEDVRRLGAAPVPLHLRNAATGLMASMGYGQGYRYAHDFPDARVEQHHLPAELTGKRYYQPGSNGAEPRLAPTDR